MVGSNAAAASWNATNGGRGGFQPCVTVGKSLSLSHWALCVPFEIWPSCCEANLASVIWTAFHRKNIKNSPSATAMEAISTRLHSEFIKKTTYYG